MRPTRFGWLVISSIFLTILSQAATRPHYGGTLRAETRAALSSLDPLQRMSSIEASVRDAIVPLVFDNLVRIDSKGAPQPQLATRWQSDNSNKHWQFWLRDGVVLQDGSTLTPSMVAQSLASSATSWRVHATADEVMIDSDSPVPGMLAALSLPQNAIVIRAADGTPIGSGPFRIAEFQSRRRLLLQANEEYWDGRPYLDAVDMALGQTFRDQVMHLQLGRADAIEVAPEQARRAVQESRHVVASSPCELIAVVIPHGTGTAEDPRMREALSLAVDRSAIQNMILQRQGYAAGSMLPQWVGGYAFLFPTAVDTTRARQLRAAAGGNQAAIPLAYDPTDAIARTIAERIALNARDVGIAVQPVSQAVPGTQAGPRIARIRLGSSEAQAALASFVSVVDAAQLPRVLGARSIEELYEVERALLDDFRILPIAHVPQSFALSQRVRNWSMKREGGLPLENVWLEVASQ